MTVHATACRRDRSAPRWAWLLALLLAFGIGLVHAHVKAPLDVSQAIGALVAELPADASPEPAAEPAPEPAFDVEILDRGNTGDCLHHRDGVAASGAAFASHGGSPHERPPRHDPVRA